MEAILLFFRKGAFSICFHQFSTQFIVGKPQHPEISQNSSFQSLSNQRGQALVEYILVLVVVIAILLVALAKLFLPAQSFLNQLTGEAYIGCLLETGALPTLNGESTVAVDSGCAATFEPGDTKAMAASGAGNGSDASGSRNRGQRDRNANGDSDSESKSGRGRRGPILGSSRSSRADNGAADGGGGKERFSEGDEESASVFKNSRSRGGGGTGDSSASNSASGAFAAGSVSEAQRSQIRKQENKSGAKLPGTEEEARSNKKKPFHMKKDSRDIASAQEEEEFSFGMYFKYFIIICVIIVLILVIGGQFMQLSKNLEKKG